MLRLWWGLCFASVAILACFVEMVVGPSVPAIVPSRDVVMWPSPSLFRVLWVRVPRCLRYYEWAPTSRSASTRLLVVAPCRLPTRRLFAPGGGCRALGRPSGRVRVSAGPMRWMREDRTEISQVPSRPFVDMPRSQTPAGPKHQTIQCFGIGFRSYHGVASSQLNLSGLNSAAYPLPVYASPLPSPTTTQHSVPAVVSLTGRGLHPRGRYRWISAFYIRIPPSLSMASRPS